MLAPLQENLKAEPEPPNPDQLESGSTQEAENETGWAQDRDVKGRYWHMNPSEIKPITLQLPDYSILEKVDLSGCSTQDMKDQQKAKDLVAEFADVSSHHDLDMGKMSLVKHRTKLKLD